MLKCFCSEICIIHLEQNLINNHIYIIDEDGHKNEVSQLAGLEVTFLGNNNTIEIHTPIPTFIQSKILCNETMYINIGGSKRSFHQFLIYATAINSKIIIGKDFSCREVNLSVTEANTEIIIGNDCMFSSRIYIINADSHVIIDNKSKKLINEPKSIYIGNHVWLGRGATLLKGTRLPDNSIVGAASVVTKSFSESNVIIAGNPAKIVKHNIDWKRSTIIDYKLSTSVDEKSDKAVTNLINYILSNNKIMLWGASLFLQEILSAHSHFDNIVGIIDKDPSKCNMDFCGYKIYSPESLNQLKPNKVFLTIFNNNIEIYEALKEEFAAKYPNIELINIFQLYKHYCPYCKQEIIFKDYENPSRSQVRCPICDSLERHRFLYKVYNNLLENNRHRNIKILHTRPENCIYYYVTRYQNVEYTAIDLHPEKYSNINNCLKMNILDMEFEDNSFDYIFSNHVIEHIDDEAGFFRECLRVLKPEGKLVLTAPYDSELEKTFEDPSIITEEERLKYYGHKDHVRKYGKDMFNRFSKYGLVSVIGADFLSEEEKLKMNLGKIESAAVITKFSEN